jgi:hypothetical protein
VSATPTLLDAVEVLLRIHDEPAGFVGKYGKELDKAIRAQQAKVDAAVALARAALVAHPAQPAADERVVSDLAALVRQLAWLLKRRDPNATLPARAVEYLRRQGLEGSPLRAEAGAAHGIGRNTTGA